MSYQRNNNTPQYYECRADFRINWKWMNPSAVVAGVSLSKALTRISQGKMARSRSETGGRTKKRGALGCPFGKTGWWNVLLWLICCSCRVCDLRPLWSPECKPAPHLLWALRPFDTLLSSCKEYNGQLYICYVLRELCDSQDFYYKAPVSKSMSKIKLQTVYLKYTKWVWIKEWQWQTFKSS